MTDEPVSATPTPALAYMQALDALSPMTEQLDAFGLLRGAWRSGVVRAAAEPATVMDLAAATGLVASRVGDVARALEAIEVFDRSGDDPLTYVVAPAWQPLLLAEPPLPLEQVFDFCSARIGMISAIVADDEDYWQVDDAARLAYAVGVAVDPTTPNAVNLLGPVLASYAEQHEQFQRGGRYLELGCGAAGMCNTILQIYPELEAVGIEPSDVLAAKARERAEAVGVADRFTVICGDVLAFDEPDSFDSVFWSQFFFPEPARRGALDVALRSLKPGGTLRAPLMSDPVSKTPDLRTSAGRTYALDRVVHGGWGVPARGVDDLKAELTEAGFVETEFQDVGFARIVAARKPGRPTS